MGGHSCASQRLSLENAYGWEEEEVLKLSYPPRVPEGQLLPRGLSFTTAVLPTGTYRMLFFCWEGKRRRSLTYDLVISPGLTIRIGYIRSGWRITPQFSWHFFYNCRSAIMSKLVAG